MTNQPLIDIIVDAWEKVCHYIADGHADEFTGPRKETLVLGRLRGEIVQNWPNVAVESPEAEMEAEFGDWYIDLVCIREGERAAISGDSQWRLIRFQYPSGADLRIRDATRR